MNVAVVAPFKQFSLYSVAKEIARVLKCPLYDFEQSNIPEKNIIFVGEALMETFSYLGRFLPEKNVIFYATVEGFPIIEPYSVEMEISKKITIVANSEYTKMCLEAVGLKVDGVIHHGVDMHQKYDKKYLKWAETFLKGRPLVLYVAGNIPRKALDKFMLACKLVKREVKDTCFILHSGGGYYNISELLNLLQIKDFWFTNQFGKLPQEKLNALYKRATVYVQASYCEGFGVPMIEAFRFLTPVIAVDTQPYSEIVSDGTGILVPCLDVRNTLYLERVYLQYHLYSVDDLADSITAILNNENLRIRMRKQISGVREKFDSNKLYKGFLSFLK